MKKIILAIVALLGMSGPCLAENEVTVDPATLRLTIPTVVYQGARFSATLGFNGSCFVLEELTPRSNQVNLTHDGFDFSSGATTSNWSETDGYITVWAAREYPSGYQYGDGFWWMPADDGDRTVTPIQDMGAVELSSVTSVPTNWTYVSGSGDYPLVLDHVYVVKARDGYAKFKVISMSGMEYAASNNWDPFQWTIGVEYAYTSGSSF